MPANDTGRADRQAPPSLYPRAQSVDFVANGCPRPDSVHKRPEMRIPRYTILHIMIGTFAKRGFHYIIARSLMNFKFEKMANPLIVSTIYLRSTLVNVDAPTLGIDYNTQSIVYAVIEDNANRRSLHVSFDKCV